MLWSSSMENRKVVSSVFVEAHHRGHEQVSFHHAPEVGLRAIVAIHSTALGPAMGGCRLRIYGEEGDALDDVMRLSEAMTYKNALAGLALGGGKAVILVDPNFSEQRRELFLEFGRFLNGLGGRYITAEDMGTRESDISTLREVTSFAAGFPVDQGGSGDPSPWTALGVFVGIQAVAERLFNTKDLTGKRVLVQGVGSVGAGLVNYLKEAGARVIVSDSRSENLARVSEVEVLEDYRAFAEVDCDIYSPCAVGQTVNDDTVPQFKCKAIAGAANNQLSSPEIYGLIESRNILYCPDFVLNAGGVISIGGEYLEGGWSESWVRERVLGIGSTVSKILTLASQDGQFPEVTALRLAKEIVANAKKSKLPHAVV